ncbi:S41 family peptidase [Sphingomonas solaris]|nr:S41 family peptidase [Sphingomonas solaris]
MATKDRPGKLKVAKAPAVARRARAKPDRSAAQKAAPAFRAKRGETLLQSPGGQVLAKTFALQASTALPVYPIADRLQVLEQLALALEGFYVHLPRKKAIYGFDPVRALGLLRLRATALSDAEFHENLVEIVTRVRDRHVSFAGRSPYGRAAVLPFLVESCWEAGKQVYVVTKLTAGVPIKSLQPGARVTHWNGIAIERYLRLNANMFDGGNEASSLARSLAFLTYRPLAQFGPPLEEWVDIKFTLNGAVLEERFIWAGFDSASAPRYPAVGRNITGYGGDLLLAGLQDARRIQTAPDSFDPAPPPAKPAGVPTIEGSGAGGVFDYGRVTTVDGTFAYLRFWSFGANNIDDIVNAVAAVLPALPQTGLIFDMRGNTGGYIAAGERVLQLFSAMPVVPARFQFRVTPLTRAMAEATDYFVRWRPSFAEAFSTGDDYTRGIPIEGDDADYNQVGRKYPGPVVLISDALAFSTADMFAAGFIDNRLGKLICTDANMAAAGGNNWRWDVVRMFNPDFRLDASLKADLIAGKLSAAIVDAFNAAGCSLSKKAVLSPGVPDDGDTIWTIQDGALAHSVRDYPWMSATPLVYLARSPAGLTDLPTGFVLGLTIRRAIRVRKNEGRVLEDTGIEPDIFYQMTLRDITDHNQDLLERAGKELIVAQPPAV